MSQYQHDSVEKKWQARWEREGAGSVEEGSKKPKAYVLVEFPYPSGDGLHVGHVRSYTALDVVARKKRMEGKNVLYPIGWDAFGLPTENYALKTGRHPADITKENVATFERQMKALGLSFDWSRVVNTTDPSYYKWTQWIFLQLLKKGLAYQAEMPINWCPKDKIGLANEEVVGGCCERCGTQVVKKLQKQWMLKITAYAERLLKDLDTVDYLPHIKDQQVNWIGKSEGAEIEFQVTNSKLQISVFTTRPDTLFGATYVVLAPEKVAEFGFSLTNQVDVNAYLERVKKKSEIERTDATKEKTGVELKGVKAINPATKEEIPIYAADYVLPQYGTGAIMAVPAHDERDHVFATKYGLGIREVVLPYRYYKPNPPLQGKKTGERKNVHAIVRNPKTGKILALRWKHHPWITFPMGGIDDGEDVVDAARREAHEETGYKNLQFVRQLGGQVKAEYFAAHKDENRISYTKAICFDLIDEERDIVADKEQEQFDVIWLDPKEVTPETMTHAELDVWLERMQKEEPVYTGEGALIDSGEFSGMASEEARKKITARFGTKKVQYKLRDWVFSRQHYWGEPIPVVHCLACKDRVEKEAHELRFYNQDTWSWLASGKKTVETRALNPEEPGRYFGNIKEGSFLKTINMVTKDMMFFRVLEQKQFRSVKELFANQEYVKGKDPFRTFSTVEELEQSYAYTPDYIERVKKNGIIGWRIERVLPGVVAVPEKELPVELPHVEKYQPTDTGESPLANMTEWVNTKCPKCGGPAKRETDTMPNWAGSSWYYLRYCDPRNDKKFADRKKLDRWLPVDLYNGGMEHTVLHLLYSRFWHKFLFDEGLVPNAEPYAHRHSHGIILGEDGRKMSKSFGNVINPDEVVKEYGADALRLYELFMGPYEEMIPWSHRGIVGCRRFLERVVGVERTVADVEDTPETVRMLNQTIKKVGDDVDAFRFNTAVSALMIFANHIQERSTVGTETWKWFVLLLFPFAPHLASELWDKRFGGDIGKESWPSYDATKLTAETFTLVVQVNGKVRSRITVPAGMDKEKALAYALEDANVKTFVTGEPKNVVFVKDKLLNIVV